MKLIVRGAIWSLLTPLVIGALLLVGCNRSATADLLPEGQDQEEEVGETGLDLDAQNATMQALLSSGLTETAAAPEGDHQIEETPEPQEETAEVSESSEVVSGEVPDSSDESMEVDVDKEGGETSTIGITDTSEIGVAPSVGSEVTESEGIVLDVIDETLANPAFALPTTYVVQEGDWIYMIARDFNVDAREVISANPGFDPEIVLPGQELLIPAPSASDDLPPPEVGETGPAAMIVGPAVVESSPDTYVVESGDTVFSIGAKHNVAYAELAAANDISAPYLVYPGQVLEIP